MISIEKERSEGLNKEGVTKLADSLLAVKIVDDYEIALKFADRIGAFVNSPLDVETEGNEVKASLSAEGGRLQASFGLDSFKLSFRNKAGTGTYEACSPVVEVKLRHPFLRFKLQNGDSVRAIKEYETISIEHLGFDLYDLK